MSLQFQEQHKSNFNKVLLSRNREANSFHLLSSHKQLKNHKLILQNIVTSPKNSDKIKNRNQQNKNLIQFLKQKQKLLSSHQTKNKNMINVLTKQTEINKIIVSRTRISQNIDPTKVFYQGNNLTQTLSKDQISNYCQITFGN